MKLARKSNPKLTQNLELDSADLDNYLHFSIN
jgi:hypothetical protein